MQVRVKPELLMRLRAAWREDHAWTPSATRLVEWGLGVGLDHLDATAASRRRGKALAQLVVKP